MLISLALKSPKSMLQDLSLREVFRSEIYRRITKISLCCGILSSLIWQDTIERASAIIPYRVILTSRTRNVGSVSQTIFRALDKMAAGSGLGTGLGLARLNSGTRLFRIIQMAAT